jgi:hypothetical protein
MSSRATSSTRGRKSPERTARAAGLSASQPKSTSSTKPMYPSGECTRKPPQWRKARPARNKADLADSGTYVVQEGCGERLIGEHDQAGRVSEDVTPIKRVLWREVDSAVQLEHDPASLGGGEEVDAHEVRPDRGSGCESKGAGPGRRRDAAALRSEGDVRPPFARRRDPLDRSDHLAADDEEAKVVAARGHELLQERPLLLEPPPPPETAQHPLELVPRPAEHDVATPASEPGLDYDREIDGWRAAVSVDVRRPRVGDSMSCQTKRRRELVVDGEEGARIVEDADALTPEPTKLPQAGFDPVQGWTDVETGEGDVVLPCPEPDLLGIGNRRRDSEPVAGGQEGAVRRRRASRDEEDGPRGGSPLAPPEA